MFSFHVTRMVTMSTAGSSSGEKKKEGKVFLTQLNALKSHLRWKPKALDEDSDHIVARASPDLTRIGTSRYVVRIFVQYLRISTQVLFIIEFVTLFSLYLSAINYAHYFLFHYSQTIFETLIFGLWLRAISSPPVLVEGR